MSTLAPPHWLLHQLTIAVFQDKATTIYHTFSTFCYFTPILGAWIADQFLGKFKTIIYISLIYILGHILKTVAAVPDLGVDPA